VVLSREPAAPAAGRASLAGIPRLAGSSNSAGTGTPRLAGSLAGSVYAATDSANGAGDESDSGAALTWMPPPKNSHQRQIPAGGVGQIPEGEGEEEEGEANTGGEDSEERALCYHVLGKVTV